MTHGTTSPQRSHHPLPAPPTPTKSPGLASTSTPIKISSALTVSAPTADSNPSYADSSRRSVSAAPAPAKQILMDRFIESELHNAIFYDPKFIERFLSGDSAKLEQVHEECGRLNEYYREYDIWQLPSKITTEKSLYEPLLKIFNTIKKAVDAVDAVDAADASIHTDPSSRDHEETDSNPPSSDNDQSGNFVPSKKLDRTSKSAMPSTRSTRSNTGLTNTSKPPMPTKPSKPSFIDNSKYSIPSDRAETELIKPDLVLFEVEEKHKHWEHVRLPIEIKKQPGHQKAAMKQLSRYARAVFAHQLHRRHLYAMMVCGTEATFVRFDRAGILYSGPLDLRKKSKAFTDALASLLLLNKTDQGYDPAFTCKMNEQGRLVYFVDLPASAFANQEPTTESTTSKENQIRRFEVAERLCHRRSICGRATIVLRIGIKDSGEEYILKIMWRDPERDSEGEVLRQVKGTFGLAQYVWHGDASGNCRCASQATRPWGCSECVARTVQLEELEICEQMTDIAIPVPPEVEGGDEVELMVVDTTSHRPTSRRRPHRICAFLVISSRGAPLEQARTAQQFMKAVLDAILGYWGLFNAGILHRDISEGNVLMLHPGQGSKRRADAETSDESEKKLREVLDGLDRKEATGMLSDLDLHAKHRATPRETIASGSNPNLTIPGENDRLAAPSPIPASSRSSGTTRRSQEDSTEDTRSSKKRKTSSRPDGVRDTSRSGPAFHPARSEDAGNRLIDFRTGTPAFMSIRVVNVKVGERYYHTFLDDIESFFWLVLWSAAAHLDSKNDGPTPAAQSMLNLLNEHNPDSMVNQKKAQLMDCFNGDGIDMLDKLDSFQNSWASHPIFKDVIVKFGTLAHKYYYAVRKGNIPSPVDVFPAVVGIFQEALAKHRK